MSSYGKYRPGEKAVGSLRPVTDCTGDKGFTVQSDRDEADINKIISRFEKSGSLPPVANGEPFYGDVSEFDGLAESLIKIQEADRLFMTYPAQVRERFENDKVKFIEFLADDNNRAEAIELGLIQKDPTSPEVASPPAPPPAGGGPV